MYTDPQSDKGMKSLYKMLGSISNPELKATLKATSFDPTSVAGAPSSSYALPSKRLFPVNTPENTTLSKVYYDAQKGAMPKADVDSIGKTIDTHLALHGVPEGQFTYKEAQAAENKDEKKMKNPQYMLPKHELCKVASSLDLGPAAKLFEEGLDELQLYDRVEYARNFVKAASELGVRIKSPDILKYAGVLDFDAVHAQYALELRSGLARRKGKPTEKFNKLACALSEFAGTPTREELIKLAEVITELDKESGITEKDYARNRANGIDAPHGVVFSKLANEASEAMEGTPDNSFNIENMTKADIVGKYGEDILDAVENADGTIDYEALKEAVRLHKNVTV